MNSIINFRYLVDMFTGKHSVTRQSEEITFFPLTSILNPNSCLCCCCCFSKVESHPPQSKQLFYINPVAASRLTNATAKVRFFKTTAYRLTVECIPSLTAHMLSLCSNVSFFSATVAALRFHGNLSS